MARIAGIDLPKGKRGVVGLTYIHGIGSSRASYILSEAKVSEDKKVQDWTDSDISGIRDVISKGFKVEGDTTNVYFLDDDGQGNVRRFYFVGAVRTYVNNTQGTINYSTGQITLNSLNIASISNIRGSSSTVIELTVTPSSNDIVPVRAQILEIDTSNSTITVEADTLVGGSADAGVGYTTSTSY